VVRKVCINRYSAVLRFWDYVPWLPNWEARQNGSRWGGAQGGGQALEVTHRHRGLRTGTGQAGRLPKVVPDFGLECRGALRVTRKYWRRSHRHSQVHTGESSCLCFSHSEEVPILVSLPRSTSTEELYVGSILVQTWGRRFRSVSGGAE
jgi:hypothetical protein